MWLPGSLALFASSALLSTVDAIPAPSIEPRNEISRRDSKTDVDLVEEVEIVRSKKPQNAAITQQTSQTSVSHSTQTIRGVNIGGWLVLEPWMTPDVVSGTKAVDQWTFDSTPSAAAKLQKHWSTFFTQSDVQTIASWGLNAIRIPIGFWAYDNTNTPYLKGADVYLQKAIGWARASGLKVMIDLHGLPGSQNGSPNSGHSGSVQWQTTTNLQRSISVLSGIAAKYGTPAYADVVYAIELANEPIPWGANNLAVTQQWTQQAFAAVKSVATNPKLQVVMHDAWMSPVSWVNVGAVLNKGVSMSGATFALDVHLYQNQMASDALMSWEQHVTAACQWTQTQLLQSIPSINNLPIYVGEFSVQTDLCAFTNGTIIAGSTCAETGCQCTAWTPVASWSQTLIKATRMFVEAQLQAFESASNGWFMWTYKGPGAWSMVNAVQYGLIGKPITQRQYPNICSSK